MFDQYKINMKMIHFFTGKYILNARIVKFNELRKIVLIAFYPFLIFEKYLSFHQKVL